MNEKRKRFRNAYFYRNVQRPQLIAVLKRNSFLLNQSCVKPTLRKTTKGLAKGWLAYHGLKLYHVADFLLEFPSA